MSSGRVKKVTAFIGSPQKRATYRAVQEFEANLKSHGDIDFEYVFLRDCHLEHCRGCCLCFDQGEERCPIKDDRDLILQKLDASDGVIFATPSYSFQVTALMKDLLDRLAFVHHRPRFFGKTFTAVVTYGIMGGASIERYLETMGGTFGFDVVRGCSLMTREPRTELQQSKISQEIRKASLRFCRELMRRTEPAPSWYSLMRFRLTRTLIKLTLDDKSRDYRCYRENGWLESDYYCDVPLGPVKRLAGRFLDFVVARMWVPRLGAPPKTTRRTTLSGGPTDPARR